MTTVDTLRETDLLGSLGDEQLNAIAAAARTRNLERSDILFYEGDEADSLFVVVSGRIAISNKSFDGRESMVALMEAGDLFGEMAFFDPQGRSAEARALEATEVIEVPFTPIRELYDSDPKLLWQVVEMLSRRLRAMDNALADSVFLDVTGRTAKRLLEMAGENDAFQLPVTQEELAGMVGASRERVNKSIAQFIKLGWMAQEGTGYRITNREQLEIRSM